MVTVLSGVFGNYFLKLGMPPKAAYAARLHHRAVPSVGGAGRGAAGGLDVSRMALLSWADLSYVLPVTLGGVRAGGVSWEGLLNEQITATRWGGIALIVAGVALVALARWLVNLEKWACRRPKS